LETDNDNLPVGLKNGAVGSAVQIAERSPHFATGAKGGIE
jgi:hypothetical protein